MEKRQWKGSTLGKKIIINTFYNEGFQNAENKKMRGNREKTRLI